MWTLGMISRAQTAQLAAPFLATIVAITLAGIAPLLILMATPDDASHSDYVGPMVIAVLAALRLSVIVGARARRLYEMVFWLYVYVFLGIAPMIQMRIGIDTDTTPGVNHDLDWQASGVVLAGCVAFLLGVVIFRGRKAAVSDVMVKQVSRSRANLLTLGMLAFFAYYASRLGFSSLFSSRQDLDLMRNLVWTDKTTAGLMAGITSMGLLVSTIAQLQRRRLAAFEGRPKPLFMPLVSLVALVICVNPVNSPRYVFGTVFLALIGAFGAYGTVRRFRVITLAAVFGMVYLFPIADLFRRSLEPGGTKSQNPLQSMLSGDFDSFSQITNTIDYVAANGISWGRQMLGVMFFWIPRSMWPDKPLDTGTIVAQWKMYGFSNLSSPLWAEFFVNGGWVLVVAGMFAFGVLICRLDRANERVLATTGWPSVTACILPFYMLIVLRGSLLQSMASLAVILVASAFVNERRLSSRPDPVRRRITV